MPAPDFGRLYPRALDGLQRNNETVRKRVLHLVQVIAVVGVVTAYGGLPRNPTMAVIEQYDVRPPDGETQSDQRNHWLRMELGFSLPVIKNVLSRKRPFLTGVMDVEVTVPAGEVFFLGLALLTLGSWELVKEVCAKTRANGVVFDPEVRCPWIVDVYRRCQLVTRTALRQAVAAVAIDWSNRLTWQAKRRKVAHTAEVSFCFSFVCIQIKFHVATGTKEHRNGEGQWPHVPCTR